MALQQPGIPVAFDFVLPAGAYAESVEPVRDFDASKAGPAGVQARDKVTGHPLWTVNVYDPDPRARTKAVKVKIASPVQPTLPEAVGGMPFRPVEFDGMTVPVRERQGPARLLLSSHRSPCRRCSAGAGEGWCGPVTALNAFRSDGRCHLNLNADGARITHLSAHVDAGRVMRAIEYPAESRIVLDLGNRSSGSVAVFIHAAELARLIAAYTRVARRPYEDEPAASGAA